LLPDNISILTKQEMRYNKLVNILEIQKIDLPIILSYTSEDIRTNGTCAVRKK